MNIHTANGKVHSYKGQHCLYCKSNSCLLEIKQLYDLSFNNIIKSYEQGMMTNEDYLQMNPKSIDDKANRPNYATTLE